MPSRNTEEFPLYWTAKEELANVRVSLTKDQQEQRARDREVIKAIDDYYAPHRDRWRANGALYNLIQTGTDDVSSNWYLGWARLLINHAQAMLTAGDPRGDFDPEGNQDFKMRVLVNAYVEHAVKKCNWHAHQRLWVQDLLRDGNGVTESYSERPMRKKKYERADGTMFEKVVRDFRRAKVGIRRRSPYRCMRSTFITDPDDVPVSIRIEEGTWNDLAIRYGSATLEDGTAKYDMSQIPVGSHYRNVHLYDEQENCIRIYCLTYGQTPEAKNVFNKCPGLDELGCPIYDKPLARYKILEGEGFLMGGANVPGMSPLAFATLDDQLDPDFETYATVGMGIPQIIEGPESVMHGLVNMSIDNERLRSTIPISYEPNNSDSPSALDLDVRTMYSGLVIDGKITPQPLGLSSAGSNQVLWEWLKFIIYQLSGVNPEPLTGDSLSTAYQTGVLMRQMNIRMKSRIDAWSNGPLKRAWHVLGANALSEATIPEWEEITDDEAKRIQEMVKNNEMTGEDYDEEETIKPDGSTQKIYKKKRQIMIPVRGYKFREDFTRKNKKRTLNANATDNTLIEDQSMKGNTSYVPADPKYLLPSGSIESILEYQVSVDGGPMLMDLKAQDMQAGEQMITNAQLVAQLDATGEFLKKLDPSKLFMASISPLDKTEDDVFRSDTNQSELATAFNDAAKKLTEQLTSPTSNVPSTSVAPVQTGNPQQTDGLGLSSVGEKLPPSSQIIQGTADGTL